MKAWQRFITDGPRRRCSIQPAMRLGAAALMLTVAIAAFAPATVRAGRPLVCVSWGQPQCVYNIVPAPHGTYARLAFDTEYAAVATVTLSSAAPVQQADGTWAFTTPTFGFVVTPKATHHVASFTDLQPRTDYHYLISAAKGPVGPDYQIFGILRTLTRHARVTFTSIHVTDDSDSGSPGDLIFWFYANGWLSQVSDGTLLSYPLYDGSPDSEAEVSSGSTIALPANEYSQEIAPAPPTLSLRVSGWDDDCDFGQFCNEYIAPHDAGGGSDSERDWATAVAKTVSLAISGPGEAFTLSISMETEDYSLKFEAAATIKVWYA
jgi:hypothetical protein